jgi:hypothetical protein
MTDSIRRTAVMAGIAAVLGCFASTAAAETATEVPITMGRVPSPTHDCPPIITAGGAAYFAIVPGYSVVGLISPDLINPSFPAFTITLVNLAGTGGAIVCRTPAIDVPTNGSVTTTAACEGVASG